MPTTVPGKPEKHTAKPGVSAETNQKSMRTLCGQKYSFARNLKLIRFSFFSACGLAPLHPRHEVRIVGGRNAAFGSWPWQVTKFTNDIIRHISEITEM